jgi:hypothetical protein
MRWRYRDYGWTSVREYWLDGQWECPTLWRHHWFGALDSPTPDLAVHYGGPGRWFLETPERGTTEAHDWHLSRLDPAEVWTMLTRHGHGPDFWSCACDGCVCECGLSWHNHPSRPYTEQQPPRASCPYLEGLPALPPECPEVIAAPRNEKGSM